MAVDYHTHTFPTATKVEAEAATRNDVALAPASLFGARLPIVVTDTVRGVVRLTVSSTAPLSPVVNDVWIDTA
jgi:hypothetical protein